MFSLLASVIAVILVVVLVLAVMYYGGNNDLARAKNNAGGIIAQGNQLVGAYELYVHEHPNAVLSNDFHEMIPQYLAARPNPEQFLGAGFSWTYDATAKVFMVANSANENTCKWLNVQSGIKGGSVIPSGAITEQSAYCFGASAPYNIVFNTISVDRGQSILSSVQHTPAQASSVGCTFDAGWVCGEKWPNGNSTPSTPVVTGPTDTTKKATLAGIEVDHAEMDWQPVFVTDPQDISVSRGKLLNVKNVSGAKRLYYGASGGDSFMTYDTTTTIAAMVSGFSGQGCYDKATLEDGESCYIYVSFDATTSWGWGNRSSIINIDFTDESAVNFYSFVTFANYGVFPTNVCHTTNPVAGCSLSGSIAKQSLTVYPASVSLSKTYALGDEFSDGTESTSNEHFQKANDCSQNANANERCVNLTWLNVLHYTNGNADNYFMNQQMKDPASGNEQWVGGNNFYYTDAMFGSSMFLKAPNYNQDGTNREYNKGNMYDSIVFNNSFGPSNGAYVSYNNTCSPIKGMKCYLVSTYNDSLYDSIHNYAFLAKKFSFPLKMDMTLDFNGNGSLYENNLYTQQLNVDIQPTYSGVIGKDVGNGIKLLFTKGRYDSNSGAVGFSTQELTYYNGGNEDVAVYSNINPSAPGFSVDSSGYGGCGQLLPPGAYCKIHVSVQNSTTGVNKLISNGVYYGSAFDMLNGNQTLFDETWIAIHPKTGGRLMQSASGLTLLEGFFDAPANGGGTENRWLGYLQSPNLTAGTDYLMRVSSLTYDNGFEFENRDVVSGRADIGGGNAFALGWNDYTYTGALFSEMNLMNLPQDKVFTWVKSNNNVGDTIYYQFWKNNMAASPPTMSPIVISTPLVAIDYNLPTPSN